MSTDFLSVLREFQERNVRYVLVGGLAVLLHGIDRLTADIDLVVDLMPAPAIHAITLFWSSDSKLVRPLTRDNSLIRQ